MSLRYGRLFDKTVRADYERALTLAKERLDPILPNAPSEKPKANWRELPLIKSRLAGGGRELVVHVSGAASGKVRVGFVGRLRGRTVASGATTVALKHGRLTVTFRLGPRTAAHALIRVSAKLDHEPAVTSTLRRHTARRGG